MSKKDLFNISWLALGLFLFLVGRDKFLLIPVFGFENIVISTRSQLLYIYIIIASYFWYRGWWYSSKYLFIIPAFLLSSLQKIPGSLRWILAGTLVLLPSILTFFTPLAYEGIRMGQRAFPILTLALEVSFLLIKPAATKMERLYIYVFSFMSVGTVFLAGGHINGHNRIPFLTNLV